ncbi:hypothetical protein AY601_1511 [Pedobacter cryoconitis]|uniref:DUF4836 family protein n=1 Tax=Pedobacter cryoconitis TaxID=188932 RepID=A0A127VBQ5_9SPHI|nr:hypothetical protein [Pedobacter cryoconitis]AMP98428.1 hypothetical protein AY601_1511 [Pedobacter cryoconitis]
MNHFSKCAVTAIFSIVALGANAQNLVHKIPADAKAVVTLKGDNLIELMSVKEFNTTFLGKKMLGKMPESVKGQTKTIEDFGINLSSVFYYYNQSNDSVSYNCVLAPVKNSGQIDDLFKQSDKKFTVNAQLRSFYNHDSTEVVVWNDEMLLFVKSSGKESYFSRPEVSKRLGLPDYSLITDTAATATDSVYVGNDYTTTADAAMTAAEPYPEAPVVRKKKTAVRKHKKAAVRQHKSGHHSLPKHKTSKKYPKRKKIKKAISIDEQPFKDESYAIVDTANSDSIMDENVPVSAYAQDIEIDTATINANKRIAAIKNKEVASWTKKMVSGFFLKDKRNSILSNKDFVKSIDEKAEVTAWIANTEKAVLDFMPTAIFKGINVLNGYGSANVKLYLEKDAIRIGSSITLSNEMAEAFIKINNRKVNKKFLNYVNEDKLTGYMAYALDTKAYLQEYPKLINRMYGSIYKDEADMATDLFSLLLDEEAVSKVIKGDALFIFNGLKQNEVTYKTYEYNEDNFEKDTVTKTKKETSPDFLLLVSTEDTRLLNKLIAYGVKKNVVKDQHSYYEISTLKTPMPLYFAIHDGIIFVGTNVDEMKQIVNNQYQAKVSAKHRDAILKSNFSAYFSAKRLAGKIPANGVTNPQQLIKTNTLLNSLGDIYLKSNQMKGNVFSGEISMDIPAKQENALKYLFSIAEDVEK